jgi:hypothetical protein
VNARVFAVVASIVLSACSGVASPNAVVPGTTVPDVAKKGALLYAVSSEDPQVTIFSFPAGREIDEISLSSLGTASCLGASGAVWITSPGGADVVQASEYAHGATKPEMQLNANADGAQGCAQDPTTRDLAVASSSGADPSLVIFPDAPKFPPVYYRPVFDGEYEFCAYDENGDLFVDGFGGPRGTFLIELKKGSKKFLRIVPDRKIETTGKLQWFKGDLLVADGSDTSIYRMQISGTTAKTVSTTTLEGAANLSYGYALYNGTVVAKPVKNTGGFSFDYWNYPAGGQPKKEFTTGAYSSFIVSK